MKINMDKLKSLSPSEQGKVLDLISKNVRFNQYNSVHKPFPKQLLAMSLDVPELLYGGSAGGGKLKLVSLV